MCCTFRLILQCIMCASLHDDRGFSVVAGSTITENPVLECGFGSNNNCMYDCWISDAACEPACPSVLYLANAVISFHCSQSFVTLLEMLHVYNPSTPSWWFSGVHCIWMLGVSKEWVNELVQIKMGDLWSVVRNDVEELFFKKLLC